MKKVVVKITLLVLPKKKITLLDDKSKQNPLQAVASIDGISSMSMNGDKITVEGEVDPVQVVKKLRKWYPHLDTVGPTKEEEEKKKKEEEEKKKKKEEEEEKKKLAAASLLYNENYNPNYFYTQPNYPIHAYPIYEENPNSCVIC